MKKSPEQLGAELKADSRRRAAAVHKINYPDVTPPLPAGQVPRLRGGPWSERDGLGVEPPLGDQ